MTIQQILGKAVEGGWFPKNSNWTTKNSLAWRKQAVVNRSKFIERYLLEPQFWKAVGKVEGWNNIEKHECESVFCRSLKEHSDHVWLYRMHEMIDALSEGKTIEQYLETL